MNTASISNLDSFIHHTRPQPKPIATSQEIRDRGSTFVAYIYKATTPSGAQAVIQYLRNVEHHSKPASHEISAWRCMVLKYGRTGLDGPDDFEVKSGSDDDGEQWAAGKVLRVMTNEGVIDAVVIVSRWYGGTLLGAARFAHIETCAIEVCRTFKRKEELDECIATLSTLDDTLANLRLEVQALSSSTSSTAEPSSGTTPQSPVEILEPPKKPDYTSLLEDNDLPRARRLVFARTNAVKSVRATLARRKEESMSRT